MLNSLLHYHDNSESDSHTKTSSLEMEIITLLIYKHLNVTLEMFSLCVSNYLRMQILDIWHTELLKSFNFDYDRGYSVPSKRCCYRQGPLGANFKLLIFATKLLLKLIKMTLHVHKRQICIFPSSLNKKVFHSVLTCTENLASHTDTGQTIT